MKPKRLDNKLEAGSQLNLEALYTIAPSCFTEVQDPKTGETKHVVNFDTLRTLLGDDAVDTHREMYQFTWPGKQAARLEAVQTTNETLRPVPQESLDWDNTENLYIEGDNLRVLKLLQKSYLGKVKMIYIDPPYNTGKDFVYHDDFSRSATEENLAAGNIDEEGYRFRVNPDTNGRFHSDWCSMMLSRLLVAHNLLAEDGVIFISIDDNEVHNLRKICDEVFGERNFIDSYVWESTFRPDNSSSLKRSNAESILFYAKEKQNIHRLYGTIEQSDGLPSLTKNSMKVSSLSFKAGVVKTFLPDGVYPAGDKGSGYILHNDVEVKDGKIITDFIISGKVIWGQDYLDKELENGTEIIIKSKTFVLYSKKKNTTSAPNTIIPNDRVGDVLQGRSEVVSLFQSAVFSYPKPISLVRYLAEILNAPDSLILDFFSGSATTAHAVMQLNAEDLKAGKEGKRKYICVQLAETTPEDSEARKAGYTTIPEIAKERIRRAGKKIKEENPEVTDTLDTGFRVFKLDSSNYEEVSKTPGEYEQAQLDLFLDNIKTDRTELDLLFGAMLSWGVPLSLSQPLQTEVVDGCTIYNVTDGELVACFAEKVTEAVVEAMATLQPERVLFRDSCFADDKMKINLFELFKQQLDWDEREALDNIRVI